MLQRTPIRERFQNVYSSGLEIIGILMVGGFAWLWFDSLKAREAAVGAARAACVSEGLLLLDDTVALSVLKPVRGDDGRLCLKRAYDFEYSDTGNNRLKGTVVLLGHRVVVLNFGWPFDAEGRTLH